MKRSVGAAVGLLVTMVVCMTGTVAAWAEPVQQEAEAAGIENIQNSIQISAQIQSCMITLDKANIQIQGTTSGDSSGTDGKLYFFELQPYENGISGRQDYVASVPIEQDFNFTIPSNWYSSPGRVYNSFVAAVYADGTYTAISSQHYVTNPELVAENQKPFLSSQSKKGLRMQIDMLSDAMILGVNHAGTDIMFQAILGSGIDYVYDGKTYHFSKAVMEEYDRTISLMSGKGICVTAVILNGWSDATPDLTYPGIVKTEGTYHYMFNVATQKGYEETRAIAAFLAERYDGSNPDYGRVSNWVIGNEVENQKEWNYMGPTDLETYVQTYMKAFRVFYTAIKTTSANDRVYLSLGYNWNTDMDGQLKYGGRNIVNTFNSVANVEGQFDWGLAYHPYPYPLTEPEFWDDDQSGMVTNDITSPIINFKNLDVLTNYFAQEPLRAPDGTVRHIILTEQGFSAASQTRGDVSDIQAAAFAYSYYLVDSNPYIDAYLLSRQVDAPSEVATGVSLGLWECDMSQPDRIVATNRRKIWQVFKDIDFRSSTLEATEFAKSIIGIEKWSDVVPNFKWKKLEK